MKFRFSTLYTKIPHSKVLKVFNELTEFCFDRRSHKSMTVYKLDF